MGAPFLTPCKVNVTTSPDLNEVRVHPSALMVVGFWVSTAQFFTLPLSSLTSNFRKQWGLDQTHSVTVPFMVRILSSKLAAPWCASRGTECTRRPKAAAKTPAILFLTKPSIFTTVIRESNLIRLSKHCSSPQSAVKDP